MTTAPPMKTLRLTWWHLGLWLDLPTGKGSIASIAPSNYAP